MTQTKKHFYLTFIITLHFYKHSYCCVFALFSSLLHFCLDMLHTVLPDRSIKSCVHVLMWRCIWTLQEYVRLCNALQYMRAFVFVWSVSVFTLTYIIDVCAACSHDRESEQLIPDHSTKPQTASNACSGHHLLYITCGTSSHSEQNTAHDKFILAHFSKIEAPANMFFIIYLPFYNA